MNKYWIILILFIAAACNQGGNSLEDKKKELTAAREELGKLKNKIAELEKEVALADTTGGEATEETGILVQANSVSPTDFEHFFSVNGSIEAEQNIMISPETGGRIKKIYVDEGDRVKQGATIAELNTDVLQKNIEEVQAQLDLAETVYERQKKLWDQKIGSEIQYLEAKTKKESLEKKLNTLNTQLSHSVVKAPISGLIDKVFQKEGELGAPGQPIAQLLNFDKVKITADVSENYAAAVEHGDTVELTFPSFNHPVTRAPINRIGSQINPGNRTFDVEVWLNNSDKTLKANGLAVFKIRDYEADSVLVVPSKIVHSDSRGDYLYTIQEKEGNLVAKKTYITTGKSSEGSTMVTKGLQAGDRVITAGYNEVSDGNRVRVERRQQASAE